MKETTLKFWDFVREDWNKSDFIFLVAFAYVSWVITVGINNIFLGMYTPEKLNYAIAVWVFAFDGLWITWFLTQLQVKKWRNIARELMYESSEIIRTTTELLSLLAANGKEYILVSKDLTDGTKEKGIMCMKCGKTSYNPNDIYKLYCGNCKEFHAK